MPRKAEFGGVLRGTRRDSGKTLKDVADHLKISVPYLSDVELGRRSPFSSERIESIASFLGKPPQPLLEAAAAERGAVELPVTGSSTQQEFGVQLMREWSNLDDSDFRVLSKLLRERTGKEPE